MLPLIAMPRAPPSSPVFSEIADAAPARSGGADPTIRSVVSVNTGARPKDEMTNPVARKRNDVDASICMSNPNPTAAIARPPAMIDIGGIRRTILGVKVDPTTNAWIKINTGPEGLVLISVLKMDSEILGRDIILKLFYSASFFIFHILNERWCRFGGMQYTSVCNPLMQCKLI
jgi:hypothetical protein